MNRQTVLGLLLMGGVALLAISSPLVAGTLGLAGSHSSDATDTSSNNMTETKFPWGTVLHETDSETGETHVEVNITAEDDISVSTMVTDEPTTLSEAKLHDETEQFPWGMVTYTSGSDSGETDVTVIVDAEDDISLSVSAVSEDRTHQSTSTSVVQSTGDAESTTSVSQSTTSSQSTNSSVSTSSTTRVEE